MGDGQGSEKWGFLGEFFGDFWDGGFGGGGGAGAVELSSNGPWRWRYAGVVGE